MLTATSGPENNIRINELGVLTGEMACDSVGDEFNPLAEFDKYGRPNPYQDPARGRINSGALPMADGDGNIIIEASKDNIIMQNLAGKDSLLGRSISVSDANSGEANCCVIALDAIPEQYQPQPVAPKYRAQSYGRGYYH